MGEILDKSGTEEVDETETGADEGADNQEGDKSSKDGGADEGAEGADTSDDDKADDDDKSDGDEADDEAKGDDKKKPDDKSKSKPTPKADAVPETRKRNIDFITERKNRKAEKSGEKKDNAAADDEKEEDTDIADDDAKIIDKRVQKVLKPFIDKQMQDEDRAEIDGFVKKNPDFAPYAATVAKFAAHPTRKNMPIKAIFYEVAGDDLMKIGAKRAKAADDEAKESKAGGSSGKGADAEKGIWDLTPEEFAQKQQELREKGRN